MKKFSIYCLKLLVTVIALLYLCDFVYTKVYYNAKPRSKMQYIVNLRNQNYDVVFLGSSRVDNHIDTQVFEKLSHKKCINLGLQGATLSDNLLELELLVANNKLTNLYLQIDYNFNKIIPSKITIANAMPFIDNKIVKNHIKKNYSDYKALSYIPFYRYAVNDPKIGFRELVFLLINKKSRFDPEIGFTPLEVGNGVSAAEMPKVMISNNPSMNSIIDLCREKSINLIMFSAPFCSLAKDMDYYDKLQSKFPDLINLTKGYDDSLFMDCQHLKREGAALFTKDLYESSKRKIK